MNRNLMFGIALFFAIIGLALTGGERQVQAGLGSGDGLFSRGCDGGCGGRIRDCGGREGLFARLHSRRSDCGGETEVVAPDPAPSCGGRKSCHGGLLARLRAKLAERKAARNCSGEASPDALPTVDEGDDTVPAPPAEGV